MKAKYGKYRGFTLAEAMMAMVIVGSTAATILLPFSTGANLQAEGIRSTIAAELASDLMNRIVVTDFDSVISSYGSYTESQGQIKDISGTVITDDAYAKFARSASCGYDTSNLFIIATVTVSYDGEQIARIDRLISR